MKIRVVAAHFLLFFVANPLHKQQQPPHRGFVGAMRLVVQRVKSASVTVEGSGGGGRQTVSQIGPGLVALVGIHEHDGADDLHYCSTRLVACKLWANESSGGQWRRSVKQRQLSCLLVSQFTLYGTLSKKNKYQPDYKLAMKAMPAARLYAEFVRLVRAEYYAGAAAAAEEAENDKIKEGVFGAMMDVALVNDGPVTIIIESEPRAPPAADDTAAAAAEPATAEPAAGQGER